MPAPLIAKSEVLNRVFGVFRTYGYEGATLARISRSTGLGRASLYHYFPGGKDEMAREVLSAAQSWLAQNVLAPLDGPGEPGVRIETMLRNLRTGYADGEASCVINLMGVGEAGEKFECELHATIDVWIGALERLLRSAGAAPKRARRTATDAVVLIEGALVVSRALRDTSVFVRAVKQLDVTLNEELERAQTVR